MIEELLNEILSYFNVTYDEFCSVSRKKNIVRSRQVYFYIKYLFGSKVNDIKNDFFVDHSTVSHSIKKIKGEIEVNDEINNLVTKLFRKYRNEIQGS